MGWGGGEAGLLLAEGSSLSPDLLGVGRRAHTEMPLKCLGMRTVS